MKKHMLILLLVLSLLPGFALAGHDHVDIDGADTNLSGYRAATETEDGYTGDEVCSVCGAVIERGSVIPALGKQRPKAQENPPDPTKAPAPDPTRAPTPVPTAVPTPVPTAVPTAAPVAAGNSGDTHGSPDGTPVPTRVPTPEPTAAPTSVPAPAASSGGSGSSAAVPTSQPEPPVVSGSSGSSGNSGNASAASASSSRSSSGRSSSAAAQSGGRDLTRWPIFSARFPWRRLRMNPLPDLYAPAAGELVWPLPESSSPLMMLMIP